MYERKTFRVFGVLYFFEPTKLYSRNRVKTWKNLEKKLTGRCNVSSWQRRTDYAPSECPCRNKIVDLIRFRYPHKI